MNFLMDTHCFLWALFDKGEISLNAKRILEDCDNDILISIITFWEISLKYGLGKLELRNVSPEELPHIAQESGFSILHLSTNEVATFYKLPKLSHKDPFDRLIVWQAINKNVPLISKDKSLAEYKNFNLRVIW